MIVVDLGGARGPAQRPGRAAGALADAFPLALGVDDGLDPVGRSDMGGAVLPARTTR